jgi:hypothetical protein
VPGNHCRAYRPTCNIETKLKVITDGIEIDNEDKSVASLSGSIGSGYKLSIAIKSRTKAKEKKRDIRKPQIFIRLTKLKIYKSN